jgi:hypothetical protein
VNILRAMKELLGLGGATWAAWRALIGGAFGCKLSAQEAALFRTLTQREPLAAPPREQWWAVGRRGGKNRVSAAVVVFLALLKPWQLGPGEIGTVLLLASDRTQAKIAFRYILGLLESHPTLWQEVVNVTVDTITLRNGIEICIGTADNAAVRGRTILACICDEFAFWAHEQALEVLRALRPGMATQSDAMLIVISSVYAAYGPFHEARRQYFGSDDPHVLYAVGTTRQLNPTISEAFIEAERLRDQPSADAEYLCIERTDCEVFIDALLHDSLTRIEPRELPYRATTPAGTAIRRIAGADVSGGRGDATAVAVAHAEGDRVIIDACRRWPAPHDPAHVAAQVAEFLKTYHLTSASADQYGAELARSIYKEAGVRLTDAAHSRSDTYLKLLPLMTTGRIELPPDPVLRQELLGLERRTRSSGKDSVDHRPGAHDDLANAAALAAVAAAGERCSYAENLKIAVPDEDLRSWYRL